MPVQIGVISNIQPNMNQRVNKVPKDNPKYILRKQRLCLVKKNTQKGWGGELGF